MDMNELMQSYPQVGSVQWMGIRPGYREPVLVVSETLANEENGLEGDHYRAKSKNRQVTVMQWEHTQAIADILGQDHLDPRLMRRNIQVSGINVLSLIHCHFQIGEVILEGIGPCHPCSRMEENLGPGGYQAMRGHGGITCQVIKGGKIRLGDTVSWLSRSDKVS
ncbi:MAG: MOSC domain-containing protein [Saprospiraceae bacterium]